MAGEAWECDHVIALKNGGENRESNLAPALVAPHKKKTKADVKEKSIIARVRGKHIGTIKPQGKIKSAPFAKASRPINAGKPMLPARQLYREARE
jgi:hypothetical protein